ncbi:hypothetical protein HDV00_010261 [Rhizophlyctis rosea]|nr:hypothetical protein HDV00_010261 [Rhizophlyctis rosea]
MVDRMLIPLPNLISRSPTSATRDQKDARFWYTRKRTAGAPVEQYASRSIPPPPHPIKSYLSLIEHSLLESSNYGSKWLLPTSSYPHATDLAVASVAKRAKSFVGGREEWEKFPMTARWLYELERYVALDERGALIEVTVEDAVDFLLKDWEGQADVKANEGKAVKVGVVSGDAELELAGSLVETSDLDMTVALNRVVTLTFPLDAIKKFLEGHEDDHVAGRSVKGGFRYVD